MSSAILPAEVPVATSAGDLENDDQAARPGLFAEARARERCPMAGVVSQNGLLDFLLGFTNLVTSTPYLVQLFTNNIAPDVFTVAADFTVPTGSWAAAQNMPSTLSPVWDGVSAYNQQFDAIRFTWDGSGSPQTIYGYFVTTPGGILAFSEKLWPSGNTFSLSFPSVTFIASIGDLNS